MNVIEIFDFIELEFKQVASALYKTLSAYSRSSSSAIVRLGSRIISLTMKFPSTYSNLPLALQLKFFNSSFKFSAIDKNAVIKQLLAAVVSKGSGDQIPGIPFGNSGVVATSMCVPALAFSSSKHITLLQSAFQFTATL